MFAEKRDSSKFKLVDNSEEGYLAHTSFSSENYQHSQPYTVNSSTQPIANGFRSRHQT